MKAITTACFQLPFLEMTYGLHEGFETQFEATCCLLAFYGNYGPPGRDAFIMRLRMYVKPLSREAKLVSEPDGTLTLHVVAPPEKGKANREITRWISKMLGIPSSHVRIVSGIHSNIKIIDILGADNDVLARILGIDVKNSESEKTKSVP